MVAFKFFHGSNFEIGMITESSLSTLRISIADMMNLRVRAKGLNRKALPEFLYQRLPAQDISVMSTIPCGTFAVSIPHQRIFGCGYEILQTCPPGNGFVIVYARQPNSRYEAISVLFQGETIGIADFHQRTRQWINERQGWLKAVPGRYAYFAPTRDQWGVILRDNGYTVSDPSKLPNTITQGLRDYAKNQNGELFARIPFYAGQNQPQGVTLPVFAQMELTLDLHPSSQSVWISFLEYKNVRALRSLPPPSFVPDFLEWLELLTAKSGFERWLFRPGMLFGDRIEWWGDRNRRRTEHEGIDFAEGVQLDSTARGIRESIPIYAITDGDVVAVLDDFLGKTVVTRHPAITQESGDVFYTFLSHIQPASEKLRRVTKGRLIGRVNKSEDTGAPAHLHLSGAWIPQAIQSGAITLDHLHPANTSVALINFNELLPVSFPFSS